MNPAPSCLRVPPLLSHPMFTLLLRSATDSAWEDPEGGRQTLKGPGMPLSAILPGWDQFWPLAGQERLLAEEP